MENNNYYYLKLKENFFESDELKVLESLENGYLYSNILLKLYLKALKNNGKLTFNDYIPYDLKMLATITGHNVDVVEKAIKIFKNMHLIDILDNGAIYMLDMQKMIGSITSEGIRKQEYRERISKEKENGTKLGQCPNILSNSNSNSNYIYNYNNKEEKEKEEKHKHGTYGWIKLTDEQYKRLCNEFKKDYIDFVIERLDEYVQSNGNKNKYKDWNLVVRKAIRDKWSCLNEKKNEIISQKDARKTEYTQEQYESMCDNIFEVEI